MDTERNTSMNGTSYKVFNNDDSSDNHDSYITIQPSFD